MKFEVFIDAKTTGMEKVAGAYAYGGPIVIQLSVDAKEPAEVGHIISKILQKLIDEFPADIKK